MEVSPLQSGKFRTFENDEKSHLSDFVDAIMNMLLQVFWCSVACLSYISIDS